MTFLYLTAQRITYTVIVHMTQASFLSANTVNLAHLYCYILNREK